MKNGQLKCVICECPIEPELGGKWTQGHNAEPIRDGRCCGYCNERIVVPARIAIHYRRVLAPLNLKRKESPNAASGN